MEETKIEPYYQNSAKECVDMLFDAKVFKEDITRDHMNFLEDYLAFLLQSSADSVRRTQKLLAGFEKKTS